MKTLYLFYYSYCSTARLSQEPFSLFRNCIILPRKRVLAAAVALPGHTHLFYCKLLDLGAVCSTQAQSALKIKMFALCQEHSPERMVSPQDESYKVKRHKNTLRYITDTLINLTSMPFLLSDENMNHLQRCVTLLN